MDTATIMSGTRSAGLVPATVRLSIDPAAHHPPVVLINPIYTARPGGLPRIPPLCPHVPRTRFILGNCTVRPRTAAHRSVISRARRTESVPYHVPTGTGQPLPSL